MSFTLPAGVLDHCFSMVDSMIELAGKDCIISYPPKWIPCNNCLWSEIGRKSANIYKHGGPIPFPNGQICPQCNSEGGHRLETVTENVKLLCIWNPKEWVKYAPNLVAGKETILLTQGYLIDLPKILSADYLLIQKSIAPIINLKVKRDSEPVDEQSILQGRYFVCLWKRTG